MEQQFGDNWTELKLGCLRHYLEAWSSALRNKGFRLLYIDAFSGTGDRLSRRKNEESETAYFDFVDQERKNFFQGSARIAIQVKPEIDLFAFIEKSQSKYKILSALKSEFPNRVIHTFRDDANNRLRKICEEAKWNGDEERGWHPLRAVLFLDPFGCQVEWSTIEKIAKTQKIDMWYLFPSGQGINRLVARKGAIPDSWERRIRLTIGEDDWRDQFFRRTEYSDLFLGKSGVMEKIVGPREIEQYFIQRLRTIFPYVADQALPIENSAGYRMFSLCFAASNPGSGGKLAVKIASDLIGAWSEKRA